MAGFSSRKTEASTTSLVWTSRPVGVRARTRSSASVLPLQNGVSPTIPGWIALTRIGANSIASDRIRVEIAPFTEVTVVDPGYGRSFARPPKSRIEASSARRSRSWCTISVYPTSFMVESWIAPATS
jgi:hypothetical protein